MSELDKKIQKSQPDLVQSVLEAQEKRNTERVDVLITNALKQLKMSRFKPDQVTCLSLIYLARVSPKSFSQSANLKELLKSHLRRDNGPANLKAVIKNDFVLPVLAANILLACSDTPEVRAIILKRIEQWLSSNQKITENVQHLLAILCVRCQGDPQTVSTLIEMRQHWFHCLETSPASGGSVALDLCNGIKSLLHNDSCCESLIENLTFLYKHDNDVIGLAKDASKLILMRPITIERMLEDREHGETLKNMLLLVYNKLFEQLEFITKKAEDIVAPLFFKLSDNSEIVAIEQDIVEAIMTFLASIRVLHDPEKPEHNSLINFWLADLSDRKDAIFYKDSDLTTPYLISTKLRNKLVLSEQASLVHLGLLLATPMQLMDMLLQFGFPEINTIDKVCQQLTQLNSDDLTKLEIRDPLYLEQLLDFYKERGVENASLLKDKLDGSDSKDSKVTRKIKIEA